jgi:hypothetical protein
MLSTDYRYANDSIKFVKAYPNTDTEFLHVMGVIDSLTPAPSRANLGTLVELSQHVGLEGNRVVEALSSNLYINDFFGEVAQLKQLMRVAQARSSGIPEGVEVKVIPNVPLRCDNQTYIDRAGYLQQAFYLAADDIALFNIYENGYPDADGPLEKARMLRKHPENFDAFLRPIPESSFFVGTPLDDESTLRSRTLLILGRFGLSEKAAIVFCRCVTKLFHEKRLVNSSAYPIIHRIRMDLPQLDLKTMIPAVFFANTIHDHTRNFPTL